MDCPERALGCVPKRPGTCAVTVCVTSTYAPLAFCPLQHEVLSTHAMTITEKASSTRAPRRGATDDDIIVHGSAVPYTFALLSVHAFDRLCEVARVHLMQKARLPEG